MAGVAGLFKVTGSAVAGYLAKNLIGRSEAIETAAGILLLGGFALIGCALPAML